MDEYNIDRLIAAKVKIAVGRENAKFYDILRRLSNSINNAGCEDRRSSQIDLINSSMMEICDKYEDFLP